MTSPVTAALFVVMGDDLGTEASPQRPIRCARPVWQSTRATPRQLSHVFVDGVEAGYLRRRTTAQDGSRIVQSAATRDALAARLLSEEGQNLLGERAEALVFADHAKRCRAQ